MTTDSPRFDQTVRCLCGAVRFNATGSVLFNELCHCRACTWAASVSPVHLMGIQCQHLEYLQGKDKIIVTNGLGAMRHARCRDCLTQVYQHPHGCGFFALFPPTFHIGGTDSVCQSLPNAYQPKYHANYENRARDSCDALPKYRTFAGSGRLNNDGTPWKEQQTAEMEVADSEGK